MSNKILVQTQNFFVDTSKPEIGECRNATFVLPQGLMDCDESQEMRLTLNAFSMRNSWHRINQNNQVYFIVGKDASNPPVFTSTRVQLGDGNYELLSSSPVIGTPLNGTSQSLGNNIKYGIEQSLQRTHNTAPGSFPTVVRWDAVSGKYTITINTAAKKSAYAGGLKLVCFTIQQGTKIDLGNLTYAVLNTPHHLGLVPPEKDGNQWITYMVGTASGAPSNTATTWSINVVDPDKHQQRPVIAPGFSVKEGDYIQWTGVSGMEQFKVYHSEIKEYKSVPTVGTVTCTIESFNAAPGNTGPTAAQIEKANISFIRDGGSDFIALSGTTNRQVGFATSTPAPGSWPTASTTWQNGIIDGQNIAFPNDSGYTITSNHVRYNPTGLGGLSDATHFVMEEPYDIDFETSGKADMELFHDVPNTGVTAVAPGYNSFTINAAGDHSYVAVGMKVTSSDVGLPNGTTVSSVTAGTGTTAVVVLSQASTYLAQALVLKNGQAVTAGETVTQGITLTLDAAPTGTITKGEAVAQTGSGATGTVTETTATDKLVVTVTSGTFTTGGITVTPTGQPAVSYTVSSLVDNAGTVRKTNTGGTITDVDVTVTSGLFVTGDIVINAIDLIVQATSSYTEAFDYKFTTTLTPTSQKSSTIWTNSLLTAQETTAIVRKTVTWSGKEVNSEHVIALSTGEYDNPAPNPNPAKLSTVITDVTEEIPIKSSILFRAVNSGDNPTIFNDSFQSTFEVLGGCYEDRGSIPGVDASAQFDNMHGLFEVVQDIVNTEQYTCDGFYPATLQSEENIYLRTDVNSTAFQTPGFDTGLQTNVASSQILAKIPLNNPTFAAVNEMYIEPQPHPHSAVERVYLYERPFEVVYFSDNGNNEYSIMLNSKKVSHMRLFVTDKFGRLIPAVSEQQIRCGGLSFTASLRIDIFETPMMPHA